MSALMQKFQRAAVVAIAAWTVGCASLSSLQSAKPMKLGQLAWSVSGEVVPTFEDKTTLHSSVGVRYGINDSFTAGARMWALGSQGDVVAHLVSTDLLWFAAGAGLQSQRIGWDAADVGRGPNKYVATLFLPVYFTLAISSDFELTLSPKWAWSVEQNPSNTSSRTFSSWWGSAYIEWIGAFSGGQNLLLGVDCITQLVDALNACTGTAGIRF